MNIKKITALAAAVVMTGICTGTPEFDFLTGVNASAETKVEKSGSELNVTVVVDGDLVKIKWDEIKNADTYVIAFAHPEKDGETQDMFKYEPGDRSAVIPISELTLVDDEKDRSYKKYCFTVWAFSNAETPGGKSIERARYDLYFDALSDIESADHSVTAEEKASEEKVQAEVKPERKAKSEKIPAPADFKVNKKTRSVTLSWGAVEGADMYRVYKYDPETKKYEKYKDVKSAKCTISGLKAGTRYKFKVVAYDKINGKYVKGESSKAFGVTTKKSK
ncbi:MAG: fibronectin type III domain-containing protein [Bacteroides sp.]|nr:fibronectin type III domain-containing protein [Eubacterium sp.]MCM1417785.1 fibronectin type III domain-containing protein [Roseburia sp.]MCM1461324.1 fibronectin type III domain-containing protein [Bacteroides sp.]